MNLMAPRVNQTPFGLIRQANITGITQINYFK